MRIKTVRFVETATVDQHRMLQPYVGRVLHILKNHEGPPHAEGQHESYLQRAQELLHEKNMSKEMIALILST